MKELEHNLFKNVSKKSLFLWQKQIQAIEYGPNDAIRIKKEASYFDTLLIYTLWYEFLTILMPTSDLAKITFLF